MGRMNLVCHSGSEGMGEAHLGTGGVALTFANLLLPLLSLCRL